MKKLLTFCVVLGFACIFAPSADAAPREKPAKVVIAHLAEVVEELDELTGEVLSTTYYYNVIEISERALGGHGNHEDLQDGETFPDGTTFTAEGYSKGDHIEILIEPSED